MESPIKRKEELFEKSIEIKSRSSRVRILREVDPCHRPLRLSHQKDQIARSPQQASSRLRRSRRMCGLVRLEMRRLLLYKTLSSLTMSSLLLILHKESWEIIKWPIRSQLLDSKSKRPWSWNQESLMRKLRFLPKRIWTQIIFTNQDLPRGWETSSQQGIKSRSSLLLYLRTQQLSKRKRRIRSKSR